MNAARAGLVYHVVDHVSAGGTHASLKPKGNAVYLLHADHTIAAYIHLAFRGARGSSPATLQLWNTQWFTTTQWPDVMDQGN